MAITKRLRYEILRRDNHACKYCHTTDAPLTVDHVTPVALGGTDEPSNLVAACRDCNAGKSSSNPDAPLVDDVKQDALRWAQARESVIAEMREAKYCRDEYADALEYDCYEAGIEPPADIRVTARRWWDLGLPYAEVEEAVEIAATNDRIAYRARWRYLCGVVNRKLEQIDNAIYQEVTSGA